MYIYKLTKTKYQHNVRDKHRKCKSRNPKRYWSLLNNGKNNQCQVNINDELNHFEDINFKVHGEDNVNIESLIDLGNVNKILNINSDENELRKVVKCLKTGKASGIDDILNEYIISSLDMLLHEYIISSLDMLLPVYTLLSNTILSSGVIPMDWLTRIVIPILKTKGSESSVNNYCDSTLLSWQTIYMYF